MFVKPAPIHVFHSRPGSLEGYRVKLTLDLGLRLTLRRPHNELNTGFVISTAAALAAHLQRRPLRR